MANCSNLLNTQSVTLTAGTITAGFCHTNLQDTYEEFISKTTASISSGTPGSETTNVGSFTAGDDTPASGDQGKLWFRQDPSDCNAPLGWYFYNPGASPAAWEASPNPLSSIFDSSDTAGALAYHNGTSWTVLAPGTAGQVLTSNGTDAPTWGTGLPTIYQFSSTGATAYTSSSFSSTGLTGSITPSSDTAKIMVTVTQPQRVYGSSGSVSAYAQLLRGSTAIWGPTEVSEGRTYQGAAHGTGYIAVTMVDSPASASSVTYAVEQRTGYTSVTAKEGFMTLQEVTLG